MISTVIARICWRCHREPVSTAARNARICDVCFVKAVGELLREPDHFLCPGCEIEADVPMDDLFTCPHCGWREDE